MIVGSSPTYVTISLIDEIDKRGGFKKCQFESDTKYLILDFSPSPFTQGDIFVMRAFFFFLLPV
jgi:hypothetical protein